ncbi:MAG: branched-chain amino acid transport system substrate-binding protein, partial [bacterium]
FTLNAYAQDMADDAPYAEKHFSLLFNTQAPTLTDAYNNDTSATDVGLTPEQHKEIAIKSLKIGLNNTALEHLSVIKDLGDEHVFSRYAKALALSNLGEFEDALDILNTLSLEKSSFQEPAKEFSNKLKLILAQDAFNNGSYNVASSWLEKHNGLYSNRQSNRQIERIQDKINKKALQTAGFMKDDIGRPLKIALLIPLSGMHQGLGQQLLAAAQLALFNEPNPNILLYPHDTQSSEMGAISAVQKAISDRSDIILGPLTDVNTKAITQYTIPASIPVISFSSNNNIASRHSVVLGYAPEEQAVAMAKYAADKGIKSIAILAPNTPYGIRMSGAFMEAAATYDVTITDNAIFDPNSPDQTRQLNQFAQTKQAQDLLDKERQFLNDEYKLVGDAMNDTSLTRIEELKTAKPEPIVEFEALYLPVSADKLPLIASQLAFFNMDTANITLLGTAKWQNKSLHKNRAEYIRGAFFPAPPHNSINQAYNEFKQTYNKEAQALSILAYDGITLLNQLYQESDGNPRFIADNLFRDEGYNLKGGLLHFNKDGTSNRLYSIYEVRSHTSVERQKAPSQFTPTLPENIDVRERSDIRGFFNPWGF